jgi:AraC-like DNA-binding protein
MSVAPVNRSEWETTDPELAHDLLTQAYGDHVPRLSGSAEQFELRLASVGTDQLRVDELVHSMNLDAQVDAYDEVVVTNPRTGRYWAQRARRELRLEPGGLLLVDMGHEVRGGWSPIDQQIVCLERGRFMHEVEGLTGVPASQVRFEMSEPRSQAHARHWLAVVSHVTGVLAVDEVAAAPLVQADLFRMLTTAALATFPNNALDAVRDPLAPGPGGAAPAAIRRAVEFMDTHAREDIDISQIADAAGMEPRGLQTAFRRHRQQTPLEYLRRVRMEGVLRDLQADDPIRGDTVEATAARWGFTRRAGGPTVAEGFDAAQSANAQAREARDSARRLLARLAETASDIGATLDEIAEIAEIAEIREAHAQHTGSADVRERAQHARDKAEAERQEARRLRRRSDP